jgi:hypothetical protein
LVGLRRGSEIGEAIMNFFELVGLGLRNYVNFSGRATRPEYWCWIVPVVIINVVLGIVDQTLNPGTQMATLTRLIHRSCLNERRM